MIAEDCQLDSGLCTLSYKLSELLHIRGY